MRTTLFLGLCMAIVPAIASAHGAHGAHSAKRIETERPSFMLEMMHPSYEGDDASVTSGAYILSGQVPVSPTASVKFDLPFSYLNEDFGDPALSETSSSFGNPFLGVSLQRSSSMEWEFGVRPSMASETEMANLYAAFADLGRWEAFIPNLWTLSGQAKWHHMTENGLNWDVNVGPTMWLPENDGDNELWADYGAGVGYSAESYRLAARSKGRMWLTENGLNFDQRTNHQVGLFADFGSSNFRPGIELLLPVDRNSDNETTWGFTLQYTMK